MNCPVCNESATLADWHVKPQTRTQFSADMDNYVCKRGHEFEAKVPLKVVNGIALRADM